MAKPDIFHEIIECMLNEADSGKYLNVEQEIMDNFFKDFPKNTPDTASSAAPPEGISAFEQIKAEVANCTKCPLHEGRTNTVFGDGDPNADLMFIGEGPGKDEDRQGLPFVGRAGQLLTRMINAMQFQRKEVYIANIVKCRPPNNRNPEPDEAEICMPYLRRQIECIKPKVIVLLGAVPLKYLFNKTGITRIHGQWLELNGIATMPSLHPAYLLRNPPAKKDAWDDLQKVMKIFGKVPPKRKR